MEIKRLFDQGRVSEAVAELSATLKIRPADSRLRISLFEMLALQGDWARARKQLDILSSGDRPEIELAIQVYRDLIASEELREQVFAGRGLPKFYSEPPQHVGLLLVVVQKLASDPAAAAALIEDAAAAAPEQPGTADGRRFQDFRDADDRTASVFEVFQGGQYMWLPITQVRQMTITAPKNLRDLIWMHANIELSDQQVVDAFLPRFYVKSYTAPDEKIRAGHTTDFQVVLERLVIGMGPRLFLLDQDEVSLADVRLVSFDSPQPGA